MILFNREGVGFFERHEYGSLFVMPDFHIHGYHELYYLEHGATVYFCGNSIYNLSSGDFILIPKGTFHRTDNSAYPNLIRILFNFDDELAGDEYLPILRELENQTHIVLSENGKQAVRRLIEKIEAEVLSERDDSEVLAKLYFRELLVLLARYRNKDILCEYSGAQKIAQEAAVYISRNYSSALSLEMLAKKYSISPGYFSKLFKKHTGIGVNEYIAVSRVVAAKELFDTTDMSVTDVAFECGFNDSNYFSQVFKKVSGVSPKQYSRGLSKSRVFPL